MPGDGQSRGAGNVRRLTHRFRYRSPEDDVRSWWETGEDGRILRQAVFEKDLPVPRVPDLPAEGEGEGQVGTRGGASVAASSADLAVVRERFGPLGGRLYEAVYGVMTDGPPDVSHGAEPVTAERFERAWSTAVRHRHFTRYDSGPLPEGTRVTGRVSVLPWGPGRTGLFVDMDAIPVPAFVDMVHLPRDPDGWPPVGTEGAFEVTTIRFDLRPEYTGLQVRLRPAAGPRRGGPSPRPAPP